MASSSKNLDGGLTKGRIFNWIKTVEDFVMKGITHNLNYFIEAISN